eukprot:UN04207
MSAERSINSLLAIDSLIQSFDRNPVSPKQSNSNYAVGDVVRINPMRKINTVTCLARVRAINIEDDTLLQLLNPDDEKKRKPKSSNFVNQSQDQVRKWSIQKPAQSIKSINELETELEDIQAEFQANWVELIAATQNINEKFIFQAKKVFQKEKEKIERLKRNTQLSK